MKGARWLPRTMILELVLVLLCLTLTPSAARTVGWSSARAGRVKTRLEPHQSPVTLTTEPWYNVREAEQTFYAEADADVVQGYPNWTLGTDLQMWAGYDEYLDPDGLIVRSLVRFDIASLPPSVDITGATLRLYHADSWPYEDTSMTITTYRVTSSWSESSVTWNSKPDYGEPYGAASVPSDLWDWCEFDVTDLVRAWYNGTHPNYGVMVRGPEVSGPDAGWRGFDTRESIYAPELVVAYSEVPNTAPTLTGLPDQQVPMDEGADDAIDLWAFADDAEDSDSDLTFSIVNAPAGGAGVSIDAERYIDIQPAAGWTGTTDVEVEVRDTGGLTDSDTFQVIVQRDSYRAYLPLVSRPDIVVSRVIRSNEEGVVEHPDGARIDVPRGAVPLNLQDEEGEMLFTIERGTPEEFGVPSTPPAGWEMLDDIFSMGPDGFTFNMPVEVTIPLPDDFDRTTHVASMFDYDFQEEEWESVGGQVNDDGTLTADSLHLCWNVGMARAVSGRGPGAIEFSAIPRYSFKLCIEEYTLKYPDWDADFEADNRYRAIIRRDSPNCPSDGKVYWVLPQGTYKISVMVYYHRVDDEPPEYLGYFQRTITLDRPHWDWEMGGPDYEFATFFGPLETDPDALLPGRPPCAGTPTPSVGIGAINVRLEWWANADLDLWVVDPCGQRISYRRGETERTCQGSVGRLDQDNKCSNLVIGRPENIFWLQNPPRGIYRVYVDYYRDCGSAGSVLYTVRWTVRGNSTVRRGYITAPPSTNTPDDEIFVGQFTY